MNLKILLTGATSIVGLQTLKCFLQDEHILLTVFCLKTKKNIKILKQFEDFSRLKVVFGDLTKYEDVANVMDDFDVILHLDSFSPHLSEIDPSVTYNINYGGTKNIVDAIEASNIKDTVKFLFLGSVSEYGNRSPSIHYGRVGDPILPSCYDFFAISKIAAERYVIESNIKHFVSFRIGDVLYSDLFLDDSGIKYHIPLNNHTEYISDLDAAILIYKFSTHNLKDKFFKKVYNVGGGKLNRFKYIDFLNLTLNKYKLKFSDLYTEDMFAVRNFHGMFFLDSDILEDIFHFRSESTKDFLNRINKKSVKRFKRMRFIPKMILQNSIFKQAVKNRNTPIFWKMHRQIKKVDIFFGPEELKTELDSIKENKCILLNHGYDEKKKDSELGLEDVRQAARYRGGLCLSQSMEKGDLYSKLKFKCKEGHTFTASPYLILKTGHYCPYCVEKPCYFNNLSKYCEFYHQVFAPDHEGIDE